MTTPVNSSYTYLPGYSTMYGGVFPVNQGNCRISIWGQSNAIGRAAITDLSIIPALNDPALATYMANAFSRVYIWNPTALAFQPMTASINQCTAGQFGPEFGLAVRWMRETQSGNLYIEKNGYSGQAISYFNPTVSSQGWDGGQSIRHYSNLWLATNSITVNESAWIWIQGEQDQVNGTTQSAYQTALLNLITAMSVATYPIINGSTKLILMQEPVGSSEYSAAVAAAKTAVAATNPSIITAISTPLYMNSDNLHFNGQGQIDSSYLAFESIFNTAFAAI